jgi:hypothetical protein
MSRYGHEPECVECGRVLTLHPLRARLPRLAARGDWACPECAGRSGCPLTLSRRSVRGACGHGFYGNPDAAAELALAPGRTAHPRPTCCGSGEHLAGATGGGAGR